MTLIYRLDDYDVDDFVRVAADFGQDSFGFVVTPNVDHLIRFHDEASFRAAYADAAYILLDSRFLSYVFRVTKLLRTRVCPGSDLTAQLFERVVAPSDQIVLVGGDAAQAVLLQERFGLECLHHHNPPMGFIHDPAQVEECLRFVERHSPFRFCFLGVGSPQQEILAQHLKARGVALGMALCIGSSVNFLTGGERRAPRWVQMLGAEWVFRLLLNPARLAKRYLVRGPRVFALLPRTKIKFNRAPGHALPPVAAPLAAGGQEDAIAPETAKPVTGAA